jgi:hypothetical protein
MKKLLVVVGILTLATCAFAAKPVIELEGNPAIRIDCDLNSVMYDWNFADGDHGFVPTICEDGASAVWAYGVDATYGTVWATGLNGAYVNNAGEALVSPTFLVDPSTQFVEVVHFYDTETVYDGCNLEVNGQVVEPLEGYDVAELSISANYYAFCVDLEPGYTGHDQIDFVTSCFDLGAFSGQEVALEFTFGSDSSVTYPGWYLARVMVGSNVVGVETKTFSSIKALYR